MLLGLVIAGLAVPRLVAAVVLLPGDPILSEALSGLPIAVEELDLLADTRRTASWSGDARVEAELGAVLLRSAGARGFEAPEGRNLLEEAAAALRRGLTRSPADPYAWARLARIEMLLDGPTAHAGRVLRMSYLTGIYEPTLLLPRLSLAFRLWEHLDDKTRGMTDQQIRQAWRTTPEHLFKLSAKWRATKTVAHALAGSPEDLRVFRDRLRRK